MFTLDAWLEKPDPLLRITDDHSRRIVAEWRGQDLQDLLESGIIVAADCCGPHARETAHETIRELILESCLQGITLQRRLPGPRPDAPAPLARRSGDNSEYPDNHHQGLHARQPTAPNSHSRHLACAQGPKATHASKKPREIAKGRILHVAFRKCPPLH
ncbi:MAG: hypothetical protein ACQETK_08620 [Pseudomonadota bacterium]